MIQPTSKHYSKPMVIQKFSSERILGSLAQFMYTLISANSKYDRVTRDHTETFTPVEEKGYTLLSRNVLLVTRGLFSQMNLLGMWGSQNIQM